MNYIKELQQRNALLESRIIKTHDALSGFREHLHSPKFSGEEGGERKDWIATADVLTYLSNIRDDLNGIA